MTNRAEIIVSAKDASGPAFASVGRRLDGLAGKVPGLTGGLRQIGASAAVGLGALGLTLPVLALGFDRLIGKVADLQDISEKAGDTASAFGGLSIAAAVGGTDVDSLAEKSIKITKVLGEVSDESKSAGAALKAMGIPIEEFKRLNPVERYERLAKALAQFEDGPEKTAALEGLVKGGAQLLPFLKALNEEGGRHVVLTDRQIAQADEYKDKQARSGAVLAQYAQVIALQALPALSGLQDVLIDVAKSIVGVDKSGDDLNGNSAVRDFAQNAAIGLVRVAEAAVGVAKAVRAIGGSFEVVAADIATGLELAQKAPGALFRHGGVEELASILARRNAVVKEANDRYVELFQYDGARQSRNLEALFAGANADPDGSYASAESRRLGVAAGNSKPRLPYKGAADLAGAAGLEKRRLEGDLKDIARTLQAQRDLFQYNDKQLAQIYEQGSTALSKHYADRRALREAFTAQELAASDAEIARLQRARTAAAKPEERAELDNRIAEARDKRARIEVKASQDAQLAANDEARAIGQLQERYSAFSADLLALQGDERGAAALRIARQVSEAADLLARLGGDPAEAERMGKLLSGQADLADIQARLSRITEDAASREELFTLRAIANHETEADTLRGIGQIRGAALVQMTELARRARAVADALGTPEAERFARNLEFQAQKAAMAVDPLRDKLRSINEEVGQIGADAFKSLIRDGEKFSDVLRRIAERLADIILEEKLFKPVKSAISKALEGEDSGVLGDLFSGVGKFFGGLGSYATGTDYVPRDMLAVVHKGEKITPAAQNRGGEGGSVSINYYVDARGADPGVEQRLQAQLERTKREVLAHVQQQARRGGSFTTAMRGS